MSFFDLIKDGINFDLNALLAKAGLSIEFVQSLRKGSFLIPKERIHRELSKAIEEEKGVTLKSCEFSTDGIKIFLQARKLLAENGIELYGKLTI